MDSFKVVFKPSVHKDLRRLPKAMIQRVMAHLERLKDNPFPPNSIKLEGAEQIYRIRVGDYRVIYQVDTEARLVTIHYVRHRREAYRK